MGYITTRKALIQKRLASVQARLDLYYTAVDDMIESGIKSYSFDSGDGKQSTTRRSLEEVQNMIDRLEAQEKSLINDLYNMGLVSIRLRRKKPTWPIY